MNQYKAYPAYKDSGVEWIGLVPEHWDVKPFKYILSAPMSYGANEPAESDDPNLPRYIRITDLTENGTLKKDTFKSLPWKKAYAYLLSDGDILLARSGATVGKSFLYRESDGAACFAGYLIKASCDKEKALPEYIYSYLQSHPYWEYIGGSNIQSTIQNVSAEKYSSLVLPVPPREEQSIIAATLGPETVRIDALIKKKTRFIELLREKVIATAMAEQMHGEGDYIRLRYLVQIISRSVELIDDDEYIALGLYNRGRGLFHKPPTLGKDIGDSDFFYVKEGDLILSGQFAWEGAVTMASSIENGCVVSHRYPVIRGKTVATEYLLALLMTNFGDFLLNESSRGSAGRNRPLNINLLLNEKIRMPSVETQEEIKRLIKLKTALEVKIQQSIDLLKERRTAFITAAVTGQIDLRGEQ